MPFWSWSSRISYLGRSRFFGGSSARVFGRLTTETQRHRENKNQSWIESNRFCLLSVSLGFKSELLRFVKSCRRIMGCLLEIERFRDELFILSAFREKLLPNYLTPT